ncbi:MAG: hypothetical protein GY698_12515, partial [Actinomycetia bacterium]|nr:hypothetical protein [Actinomycetes bacterium]
MPITEEEIADLYRHRQNRDRERRDKQDEVSRVYNDRLIVDLPELDMAASSAAANLTETGIDQWGMRIASADPELDYALDGHIGSKESRDRQLNRKHAMTALFTQNTLKTRIHRPRARRLVAFAQAPVRIGWGDLGFKYGEGPKWMLKDPREVFPNPAIDIHDPLPDNVIYGRTVPASEAKKKWPDAVSDLNLRSVTGGDPILEIVTYDDAEELVVVIMASGRELSAHSPTGVAMVDSGFAPRAAVQELHREPNRIGICPWTVPGRIGLDELKGQFDGSSALYRTMA